MHQVCNERVLGTLESYLREDIVVEDWDWLYHGSVMTMLDNSKHIHLTDVRQRESEKENETPKAHEGSRAGFVRAIGDSPFLLSSGQNKQGERELKVWDTRQMNNCLHSENLGTGLCSMEPHVIEGASDLTTQRLLAFVCEILQHC